MHAHGHIRPLTSSSVRTNDWILKKFSGKPPSLIIHLHPTHFRFDQQDGSFGYNSPMKIIIEHMKAGTVPHEIMDEMLLGQVPFYDGESGEPSQFSRAILTSEHRVSHRSSTRP